MSDDEEDTSILLEQLMAGMGEKAPEPDMERVIHRGDSEYAMPVAGTVADSAGYVYLWHQGTGEKTPVNRNMLSSQLQKKLDNGKPAFLPTPPRGVKVFAGTVKCRLHIGDPDRLKWDELGFARCPKENLTSQFQLTRHMNNRHRVEWQTMQSEAADREKAEEREFRRVLMGRQAVSGIAFDASAPVAPPQSIVGAPAVAAEKSYACPYCDYTPPPDAKKPKQALKYHMGKHALS